MLRVKNPKFHHFWPWNTVLAGGLRSLKYWIFQITGIKSVANKFKYFAINTDNMLKFEICSILTCCWSSIRKKWVFKILLDNKDSIGFFQRKVLLALFFSPKIVELFLLYYFLNWTIWTLGLTVKVFCI